MANFKKVYELQSGGYPLGQALVINNADNEPMVVAYFADEEMDVFAVEYDIEGGVTIHAEDVTHITTTPHQLHQIIALAPTAVSLCEELFACWDDEKETWIGHEHLISIPREIRPPS